MTNPDRKAKDKFKHQLIYEISLILIALIVLITVGFNYAILFYVLTWIFGGIVHLLTKQG